MAILVFLCLQIVMDTRMIGIDYSGDQVSQKNHEMIFKRYM